MNENKPTCPYCAEPWSEAMLAAYDRFADHTSCSCSAHAGSHVHGEDAREMEIPTEDLCCDSCGKPIYSAPKLIGT
jgi:hypothetical protein